MKKNALIGLVAVVGLAGVGTALLSKNSNSDLNSGTEITNSIKSEEATENKKNNESTNLPSDVTNNFPLYPNAEISRVTNSTGDDGRIFYTVSLTSRDDIAVINDWYKEAFSQNSWSIKGDSNVGGYRIIKGEKDNFYSSMQAARGDEGKVVISQQIQIRPKQQ